MRIKEGSRCAGRYFFPPQSLKTRFAGTPGRLPLGRWVAPGVGVECTLVRPCGADETPPRIDPGRVAGLGAGAVRTDGEDRPVDGADRTDGGAEREGDGALGARGVTAPPLDRYGSEGRDGACACGARGGAACGCVRGDAEGREDGRMIGEDPEARG